MRLARRAQTDAPALVGVVDAALPASVPVERSFASLYERASGPAVRSATLFVGRDAAWDAVQQAALKMWKTWNRLRPEQMTVPYFIRVVHRNVIDQLRRERRYVELTEQTEQQLLEPEEPPLPYGVIASVALAESALIARFIERLPLRCREVWVLFREHGLTYAEIAETLELNEVTVRRHMSRAVQMLRQDIGSAGYRLTDTTIKGLLPPDTAEARHG